MSSLCIVLACSSCPNILSLVPDSLVPDSLVPDSLVPDSLAPYFHSIRPAPRPVGSFTIWLGMIALRHLPVPVGPATISLLLPARHGPGPLIGPSLEWGEWCGVGEWMGYTDGMGSAEGSPFVRPPPLTRLHPETVSKKGWSLRGWMLSPPGDRAQH